MTISSSTQETERGNDQLRMDQRRGKRPSGTFSERWTSSIKKWIHTPIMYLILLLTGIASHRPKQTIGVMVTLSLGLLVLGLFTNFYVETDSNLLWTPMKSKPIEYRLWIEDESNFPKGQRPFLLFFHDNGQNVLGQKQVLRTFEAIDVIRAQQSYIDICSTNGTGTQLSADGITEIKTCEIWGVNKFWNSSTSLFKQQALSDDDVVSSLSSRTFPDGIPAAERTFFGKPKRDTTTDRFTSVQSFSTIILMPDIKASEDVELDYVDMILELNDKWRAEDGTTKFRVEVQAADSFGSEFSRAIVTDIPLIPIVFVIMSIFTCAVFSKRDPIQSRTLLGFLAVVSVFLSIMCGYGLLFCIGTPFTSMTQILPFIVFGVGLDDAYIIMGAYDRTTAQEHGTPQQRLQTTMEDIGISITLTTLTTVCSFTLGATSSIPAVLWMCLYAFPTIAIVYVYQLTFFVGCIVLDEHRIEAQQRDLCCRCPCTPLKSTSSNEVTSSTIPGSFVDRYMVKFATSLLNPFVRALVIVNAIAVCGFFAYSSTKLTQEFKFTDVLPNDSYIADYQNAIDAYIGQSTLTTGVYFRNVDQSDPAIRQQMTTYVDELVAMDIATNPPSNFWLRDYNEFVIPPANQLGNSTEADFYTNFNAFMNDPVYKVLYRDDIVRDNVTGLITSSRCFIELDQVDVQDVSAQTDAYEELELVTSSQPINKDLGEYDFFSYDGIYNIWDFYTQVVDELILNTITGIVSVTVIGLIIIPHWSAAIFVFPMICVLYVDVLGFMQVCGVHINAVSYITMVMAIGLLVDFIMHVLLRYYECPGNRTEKTIEMLRTMGVSILTGGVSTFLGTLPLAFSTSDVFFTIFIVFLGLVIFGMSHGLIVLPVLLSMFGPEDQVTTSMINNNDNTTMETKRSNTRSTSSSDESATTTKNASQTTPRSDVGDNAHIMTTNKSSDQYYYEQSNDDNVSLHEF